MMHRMKDDYEEKLFLLARVAHDKTFRCHKNGFFCQE